jgi:4-azaleucine resistance transporter AzlC
MDARAAGSPPTPVLTRAGLWLGARTMLPALPGVIAFGLGLGAVAAQKGLSLAEIAAMSFLVCAGASQFVALEFWTADWTPAAIFAIALITFIVNLRYILMGAAMRPWLDPLPARATYPALFFLSDTNWVAAMRYRSEGGNDLGTFVGAGVTLWLVWTAASVAGHLIGARLANPAAFGLDLVMPAFFVAMLVPLWRGRRETVAWPVAGAVALAADLLAPGGWWFIVAGAVAGGLAGSFADDA